MVTEQSTSSPSSRRIEEASLNAWPALQQLLLDGWLLRFSRGFTKRANSIIPLYPAQESVAEKVRYCENLYARDQLKTIFRLTSIADCETLDAFLAKRGYSSVDTTEVLTTALTDRAPTSDPSFKLLTREDWLAAYGQLTAMPDKAQILHGAILRGIKGTCAYAAILSGGEPVACGLAVLEQNLVGLFDIYTHSEHRGRGHAKTLVGQLLAWSASEGVTNAYLQMVAANTPARGLYDKFGFKKAYDYWYRISG